jgi:hypothetical protein
MRERGWQGDGAAERREKRERAARICKIGFGLLLLSNGKKTRETL